MGTTRNTTRLTRRRAPLLLLAAVGLFAGLWGGLLLLGLQMPTGAQRTAQLHGVLMAFGFLGTMISLERAVALGRTWAYAAPLLCAAGVLAALAGAPLAFAAGLVTAAGLALGAVYVALHRIQPSLHNAVMAGGAVAWVSAGVVWMAGEPVARFVPLLAGFLVLTIVGERLELSRVLHLPEAVRRLLLMAIALLGVGLAVSIAAPDAGVRIAGVALVAQAAWLGRFDVARRTVHMHGLTRYMAVALLAGYAWLAIGGALWAGGGAQPTAFVRDAALHAVFLGFVMSMVFAHAPVIVPAVLRVSVPYRPRFGVHLALLHGSLALRLIAGGLLDDVVLWQWGGVLNEAAVVLFLVSTAAAAIGARRRRERAGADLILAYRREPP
jgi:hypothetical protein